MSVLSVFLVTPF